LNSFAKEVDARFEGVDTRFKSVDSRFDSLEKQIDSMEKRILSAIAESKAQTDLANMSEVYSLRERVAVLEAKAA
jgi:predicted  nucleic acid-binding Zn-ribbon protein